MSELLLFWSLSWMGYKKVSREIVSPEWSDQAQASLLVLTTVSWAERAVPDTRNPWEPVPDAGPGCDQQADIHISLISLNSITHFLISSHRPRTSRVYFVSSSINISLICLTFKKLSMHSGKLRGPGRLCSAVQTSHFNRSAIFLQLNPISVPLTCGKICTHSQNRLGLVCYNGQ